MKLIIRWILNTLALLLVVEFVPGFSYSNWKAIVIAGIVLGLLNAIVRPILWLITLPITVVTLGVFLLFLNAFMLELTAWLVPGFRIDSFGWAIAAAIVLGLISLITNRIGRRE